MEDVRLQRMLFSSEPPWYLNFMGDGRHWEDRITTREYENFIKSTSHARLDVINCSGCGGIHEGMHFELMGEDDVTYTGWCRKSETFITQVVRDLWYDNPIKWLL